MKKLLCMALALTLCLSAAFADDENMIQYADAPAAETEPESELEPESAGASEQEPGLIDDLMLPKGSEPLVMPVPDVSEHFEGYVEDGGARTYGTLEELLREPGSKTVYVAAQGPVRIEDFRLALLQGVELLPAPSFGGGYVVARATDAGPLDQETIDSATDQTVTLILTVTKRENPDPEPGEGIALRVTPCDFADGEWQNEAPSFALEGIPEESEDYSYAAIISDERIVPIAGSAYIAREEGAYPVRFAILDALGDVADKSEPYLLMLDFTAPALAIEVSAEHDYTMTLSAKDALSGVAGLSLDGGESWVSLREGESVVHTEARRKVFAPGTIQVRDQAGNVDLNLEEVVLEAISSASDAKKGGKDREEAPKAFRKAHAPAVPKGPVEVLTLDGEELELGLAIDGADSDGDAPAMFSAKLTAWAAEIPVAPEVEPAKDTLVVRAEAGTPDGPFTCTWRINGTALRKLSNADIRYLALAAGDAVLSLPTEGFAAGTRYAELKMEGVSTAKFEYEIVMRIDPNAEADFAPAEDSWNLSKICAPELYVEVAGERFAMIGRTSTPEMYPIDVYCGPADLPEYPYGAYPGANAAS